MKKSSVVGRWSTTRPRGKSSVRERGDERRLVAQVLGCVRARYDHFGLAPNRVPFAVEEHEAAELDAVLIQMLSLPAVRRKCSWWGGERDRTHPWVCFVVSEIPGRSARSVAAAFQSFAGRGMVGRWRRRCGGRAGVPDLEPLGKVGLTLTPAHLGVATIEVPQRSGRPDSG